MTGEHVDVLIVGAGISGIGAACHLAREVPGRSVRILERREAIGGTWDLFRYPGIRSDSDMFTFGYSFKPWHDTRILADGPAIRRYVAETAAEYGVDDKISYGRAVTSADFSSDDQRWTVQVRVEATGETETWTADFVLACTGYYDYDRGFRPQFPGEERFGGTLVHPQHWPEDLDYAGKNVVIIGSGATAVTLVPAMAPDAAHVTMLQRSPSYIMPVPARDTISATLRRFMPASAVYQLARARNIGIQRGLYELARFQPAVVKKMVRGATRRYLGGGVDMKHFTPSYEPWDQRLCVIPDGDLFRVLSDGSASIVTDTVETFDETGVRLTSGEHLDADVVITATGLAVQMLGGATLSVDGEPVPLRERVTYKGVLLEDVPNAAMIFGYINASWTLKVDIACTYLCRLLKHMDEHGYGTVVPRAPDGVQAEGSVLGALNSGYVRRGDAVLPRQGTEGPWKVTNDYLRDYRTLRLGGVADDALEFSPVRDRAAQPSSGPVRAVG